ncbi:MAG: carbon-nitrogen hydrolase family protein [Bacteroidota bacterium]|nr:carbon-nitrogen hydrolase family protein [Bacteroidota bacterium]
MKNATIEVRQLTIHDYQELKEAMVKAYASMGGQYWREDSLARLISVFPEGQIAVVVDNKVAGCALSLRINYDKFGDTHTYKEITGNYTFDTYEPDGDVLYGIEVFIDPTSRGMRLARRLYEARKNLCRQLNLKAIIAGGRIPKYHEYADKMSPKEYIESVKRREIHDPTLSFQLSNDFQVKLVSKNYLPEDKESMGFATLLVWHNIYFEPVQNPLHSAKSTVRIGCIQWQVRPYNKIEDLLQSVEYFVDAVSDYQSDFILFPELFNTPLMGLFNDLPTVQAIRELATFTPKLVAEFSKLAISYNVNIIGGSMPMLEEGELYNTSYFFHRNGKINYSNKIHITPSETHEWAMKGGNKVEIIEADVAKIGILICYDVEFPELSRILADQGMQILFVPFLTDTQNAYNRVRFCAQARAVENECYVAIAGNVGNLPKVTNMDLQFAQAAVLTPSDFPFPVNGVKAEATPNTEMIIISDVDLSSLIGLHNHGSVRNLKDRRHDLYEVVLKK